MVDLGRIKETSKDTVASWEVAADEHHQTTPQQSGLIQGSQPSDVSSNQIRRPTRRIRLRKLKRSKGTTEQFVFVWQRMMAESTCNVTSVKNGTTQSARACQMNHQFLSAMNPKKTPTSNEEENPKQLRPNDDFTDNPSQQADEEWDRKMSIPIINLETTPPFTIEQDADINEEEEDQGVQLRTYSNEDIENALHNIYDSLAKIPSGMEKSVFHAGFLRGPGRPTRGYGIQKFYADL
ncbi:uncharacterized protein [Argopecten irradians]|uniref:uncharacterized protein n=1 Tax=Argopecten irradians TaxID=31199 RepID=UPI003721616E